MMEFLYFPEDKSSYIPSIISLIVIVIAAIAAMYFFNKSSKREEKKVDDRYGADNNLSSTNYNDDQ